MRTGRIVFSVVPSLMTSPFVATTCLWASPETHTHTHKKKWRHAVHWVAEDSVLLLLERFLVLL